MNTALILAGGQASRLGRVKALVAFEGTPMVRRIHDALAPLATEMLVSVADARTAEAIRPGLPSSVRFVIDRRRALGPIEGIARGTEAARGERLLVAPCDAPLLRTDLYRLLLGSLGGHDAAVPRIEVFDPVRAIYRRRSVLRILEREDDPPVSPSALVDRLDPVFLDAPRLRSVDPRLDSFLDVNTEADLAEALRRNPTPTP